MGKWLNSYIYTMEFYSATKINKLLLHITKWINLKCIWLSEINQLNSLHVHMTFSERLKTDAGQKEELIIRSTQ